MTESELESQSRDLLAELRGPVSVPPSSHAEGREELVARLAEGIRRVPAVRREWRAGQHRARLFALAAAAVVILGVGALSWTLLSSRAAPALDRGATLVAGRLLTERDVVLSTGQRFDGGGVVHTPDGESALVLTQAGVELKLAPATGTTVPAVGAEQRFVLTRGQITLDVPPLGPGRTLTVATSDTTVVVHGTRFSVTHDPDASQPTCVRVTEGRVAVTRRGVTELVDAGGDSGCGRSVAAMGIASAASPLASATTVRPADAAVSTLAQQNRLLQQGLAAEQAGDLERAAARLEQLRARYPDSPFAPEAERALRRLRERQRTQ